MTLRTFLVADRLLTLQGARTILEKDPGIEVVGSARNLEESLENTQRDPPDVLVFDVEGVRDTTLDAPVALLKRACPSVGMVALLPPDNLLFAKGIIDAGAHGCLIKTGEQVRFLDRVVRRVAEGERVYSPEILQIYFDHDFAFTPRELEILHLVCRGKTSRGIAERLNLSHRTAQNHLTSIYEKLRIPKGKEWNRRVAAAIKARELGL